MRLPCSSCGAAAALVVAHAVSRQRTHVAITVLWHCLWGLAGAFPAGPHAVYLLVPCVGCQPLCTHQLLTSPFSSSALHRFHPLQRRRTPTSRMSPSPTSRRPLVSVAGALVVTVHGSRGRRRWLAQQQGAGGTGQGGTASAAAHACCLFPGRCAHPGGLCPFLVQRSEVAMWLEGARPGMQHTLPIFDLCRRHCALHPLPCCCFGRPAPPQTLSTLYSFAAAPRFFLLLPLLLPPHTCKQILLSQKRVSNGKVK